MRAVLNKLSIFYKKEFLKDRLEKKQFREEVYELINFIIEKERKKISNICIVFSSDRFIKKINKEFLHHNYETDIITFPDTDENGNIEGELYISIDTVKRNSIFYKTFFRNEILRVIVHGVLHLCGYKDNSDSLRKKMKLKENYYMKKIKYAE
jgi:probable rRNA maturation factor